jgi:UDP-N-acetylmuramate dehydrogenase
LVKNEFGKAFLAKLQNVIPVSRLLVKAPMSCYTTFKIGGPADYLVLAASINEVAVTLEAAQQYGIAVTVLGNGSNVLVTDKGIRGVVLKFGQDMGYIRHDATTLTVGAGTLLADVSRYAAEKGLTGVEFVVGIPGSIGGAVFMNAGAYEGEMSHVVEAVAAVCPDGSLRQFIRDELAFGYRHSIFQDNHCAICEVQLALHNGEQQSIHHKMGDYTNKRETKQPIEMPSAGSTFKRPPGYFAGTLIEQAGLKGLKTGGAQVSTKHAGFVINAGGATARDVLALIKEVQRRVYEETGVVLQPEVRVIGEE